MANNEIYSRPFVEWTIELHDDIKSLDRSKRYKKSESRRTIRTTTQIRGYLTEDGLGLVIDPKENLVEGYYLVSSDAYTEIEMLDDNDRAIHNQLYASFATLVYKKSMEDKAEFIGVFDPEDILQWTEIAINETTTPATFRFPKHILEEYRAVCSEKEQSQTDALVEQMWNTIRYHRYCLMSEGINILGNGEEWENVGEGLTFFTTPLAITSSEVEK